MVDSPYPELKKSHVPERVGRPWIDHKPPSSAPIWAVISGFGSFHVLVAALELGVFDALAHKGATSSMPLEVTAYDLAAELKVSAPHLQALLDCLAVFGLLERVGDCYGLNETAARYLTTSGSASMASLVAVAPGPLQNWSRLADTVRAGRPVNPIDTQPADFYRPLVESTFTTMFRAAVRADLQVRYSALSAPRVLDLGAGGAPWSIAILKACQEATAVINDIEGVIDVAQRFVVEHDVAQRCEFRPGDFHSIAIEPASYNIVLLGHVCRTQGFEGTKHLISRAAEALCGGGRLILADYFVAPEPQWNPHSTHMAMTMMANTINGFGITAAQAAEWLRQAGFEALRLIEPIGGQYAYVAHKPPAYK